MIGRPYTTAGGKTAHVRVRKVASPDATEIRSWSAHKRVAVSSVIEGLGRRRIWHCASPV